MKINKKYMMFGKSMPVFVIALLAVGLVSAGLVTYLSNTTNVDIDVTSPLTLASVDISTLAYGGEVTSVDSTLTNHIDEVVNGVFTMTVTNGLTNAECTDFDSIKVNDVLLVDVLGACIDSAGIATITFPTSNLANAVVAYNVDLEFAQNVAPTEYDMSSVINVA